MTTTETSTAPAKKPAAKKKAPAKKAAPPIRAKYSDDAKVKVLVDKNPRREGTLLVLIMRRSEQKRARVSAKTIKLLARRTKLRTAFLELLMDAVMLRDYVLVELESGGFGMFEVSSIQAAPAITARRYLTDEERIALRNDTLDYDEIELEIGAPDVPEDD